MEYNITMDLQEVGWRGTNRIAATQDKDSEHGNEPSGSIKWMEFLD